MKTIEYKIGDIFYLEDGTKLETVKATCNCKDCYFFNSKNNICSRTKDIICSAPRRKDKEFVIFKQIKDNNMKEKRNIQISLEEAREWYNSGDSFKRELALKAYSKAELDKADYANIIIRFLKDKVVQNNINKAEVYRKLLNIATYYNSIYPKKYHPHSHLPIYYIITKKNLSESHIKYRDLFINTCIYKSEYEIAFNSSDYAKRAIDILGDELNILFE